MDRTDAHARIEDALRRAGPLTGGELLETTGLEVFCLWKACLDSAEIAWRVVGRRYLRLDRTVADYGRLSPSIKREFLTYTVLALAGQAAEQARRVEGLDAEVRRISREKHLLARVRLTSVVEGLSDPRPAREDMCFLIAGDIVYEMAHAVDRPETSTGKMVRGSDLDVVVVTRDAVSPACVAELDRAIYEEKYHLLTHPTYREEIDYLIKPIARVREQLGFETFEHMVASKILDEARLLLGSEALFAELKSLLREAGVPDKLARLEERARAYRQHAEAQLKDSLALPSEETLRRYFYTKEEAPELF
ncbi:MAG: hypothetical protein JXQ29_09705 [Planctomycetes bacterium]|nr:hypothetical protein [Planctomycetota bacterium]